MRMFRYNVPQYLLEDLSKPIRDHNQLTLCLLHAIKYMINNQYIVDEHKNYNMCLCVDKMKRIFISCDKKIYSFNFPFSITENKELKVLNIRYKYYLKIDSIVTSILINVFNEFPNYSKNTDCIGLCYLQVTNEFSYDDDGGILFECIYDLLTFESGYIRFDDDLEHENGYLHPKYHLDIQYSSQTTWKLGIKNIILIDKFIDILNINTDCYYIE